MQPAGFGYTPASYTPSTPSSFARFGHPDTTWSGGIGSLDYGRIPITGGKRKATRRSASRKHGRKNNKSHKSSKKTRKHTVRQR